MLPSNESVPVQGESGTPSRRALLAGALGGLGAFVASAIGRSGQVRAGVDGDVVLGTSNTAATETSISNSTTNAPVFSASTFGSGQAIKASSASGVGVQAESLTGSIGVLGYASATTQPAVLGQGLGDATGVQGHSGGIGTTVPAAKPMTGVFGYAAQGTSSRGMWGESPAGIGVYGRTTTGFAGYFQGKVFTSSFHEMLEITTPSAPGTNRARLFVRDNGAGKTQLCVRFATGSVKLIAQEV